jgi:hypothetical protein
MYLQYSHSLGRLERSLVAERSVVGTPSWPGLVGCAMPCCAVAFDFLYRQPILLKTIYRRIWQETIDFASSRCQGPIPFGVVRLQIASVRLG